jgi:cob(I)alamin adenosyltransferase
MGNRLSKIYTRTGDDGMTGLGSGERVRKDSARVEAFGTIDELNSHIGLILTADDLEPEVRDCLIRIQHELFDIGGELCLPGEKAMGTEAVERLEVLLDRFNADLSPLKDFVLPGGGPNAAVCHVARSVCRRAERRTWTLARDEVVNEQILKYLNRLSDLLFVLARVLNRNSGHAEPLWKHRQ